MLMTLKEEEKARTIKEKQAKSRQKVRKIKEDMKPGMPASPEATKPVPRVAK